MQFPDRLAAWEVNDGIAHIQYIKIHYSIN